MPQSPVDIVADFYRAISARDTEGLAAAIDTHFSADAAIEWPPSLPHGGRVEGARRLRSLFTAIANPDAPTGVTNLDLVRAIGSGDEVVAWITFDWKHPGGTLAPNSALELWRFTDGKVNEIRAFYWDTDAISKPVQEIKQ